MNKIRTEKSVAIYTLLYIYIENRIKLSTLNQKLKRWNKITAYIDTLYN